MMYCSKKTKHRQNICIKRCGIFQKCAQYKDCECRALSSPTGPHFPLGSKGKSPPRRTSHLGPLRRAMWNPFGGGGREGGGHRVTRGFMVPPPLPPPRTPFVLVDWVLSPPLVKSCLMEERGAELAQTGGGVVMKRGLARASGPSVYLAHNSPPPPRRRRVSTGPAPLTLSPSHPGPAPPADPQTFQVIIPCCELPDDAVRLFRDMRDAGLRPRPPLHPPPVLAAIALPPSHAAIAPPPPQGL